MPQIMNPPTLRKPNENEERHATWLEIFFDLIFAVIVIQVSKRLMNDLSPLGILQAAGLFIPILWTWASYTVFAARFDNNDALHWGLTFIIMFAGVVMAIPIPIALEHGFFGFAFGFLLGQISLLILYARTLYTQEVSKHFTLFYLIGYGIAATFWFVSFFFEPPSNFMFWIVGMSIYLAIPWIGRKRILSKVPLDPHYIPERFGSFTIIILGQMIASVVFGLEFAHWEPASIINSILAFMLAILMWIQYYRFVQVADYKCSLGAGQPYIYAHIPFIISLIIIGVCVEKLIRNANQIEDLVDLYFCASLILYLLSFYLIQTIAIKNIKLRTWIYLGGIAALLTVFYFFSTSPVLLMIGTVIIFMVLFALQYWIGQKMRNLALRC